jgi:hypothetical protein
MTVIKRAMRGAHVGRRLDVLRHEGRVILAAADSARDVAEFAVASVEALANGVRQVRVIDVSVNAHEGGVAQEVPFGAPPPNSVILGVATIVDVPFDGNVGTIQLEGYAVVDATAAAGTVVNVPEFKYADTHPPLKITWTNDGGTPSTGVARVIMVYA